jgi:transposase InsO family protein
VSHLKNICRGPVAEGPPRRGSAGQRLERVHEQQVRRHVVEAAANWENEGWSWHRIADLIGLPERTLRDWRHGLLENFLEPAALGRPLLRADAARRNEVIHLLDELGPGVGVPSLREIFPDVARAELEDLVRRYRRVVRKRERQNLAVLHWTRPGAVWAVDFHGPRDPVDGACPCLLAVRDLASGKQLLWRPVPDMTAATLVAALTPLLAVHGAPLVVKSDNGSAFIDGRTRELLARFGAIGLFSPPRAPSYNGSIEAGIGSMTSRTEQHAARHGRPGYWTSDDAEAARLEANATARPFGPLGPSPDRRWSCREAITPSERDTFAATVARRLQEQDHDHGQADDSAADRRAKQRPAIRHALVEHGYLYITRRRIPLPISSQKAADIM